MTYEEARAQFPVLDRYAYLQAGSVGPLARGTIDAMRAAEEDGLANGRGSIAQDKSKPTKFQLACMTLPYSAFPLERALSGIKEAGFRYVAWGTSHQESAGQRVPVMASDAPPDRAKDVVSWPAVATMM